MSQESPRNVAARIAVLAHEAGGMGEEENLLRALLAKAQMTLKETDCEMYPRYFAGWLFSLVLVDRFTGQEKETILIDSDAHNLLPPEGDVVEVGPPLRPHRVTRGITVPWGAPWAAQTSLLDHPDYKPFALIGKPQNRLGQPRDLAGGRVGQACACTVSRSSNTYRSSRWTRCTCSRCCRSSRYLASVGVVYCRHAHPPRHLSG